MWDVFMDQFEVLATKAPVMLVAGNHERDFPSSGDRYNTASDSGKLTNPLPSSKLNEQRAACIVQLDSNFECIKSPQHYDKGFAHQKACACDRWRVWCALLSALQPALQHQHAVC